MGGNNRNRSNRGNNNSSSSQHKRNISSSGSVSVASSSGSNNNNNNNSKSRRSSKSGGSGGNVTTHSVSFVTTSTLNNSSNSGRHNKKDKGDQSIQSHSTSESGSSYGTDSLFSVAAVDYVESSKRYQYDEVFDRTIQEVDTYHHSTKPIASIFKIFPNKSSSELSYLPSTWKDLMSLSLFIVVFAGLSILIGITAGISISIQYYDSQLYENADYQAISSTLSSNSYNSWHNRHPQRAIDRNSDHVYDKERHREEKSDFSNGDNSERLTMALSPGEMEDAFNNTDQIWILEESPLLLHKTITGVANFTDDFTVETEPLDMGSSSHANRDRTVLNFDDENKLGGTWYTYSIDDKILNGVKIPNDIRTRRPHPKPPSMNFHDWASIHPKLCSDGSTIGYDSFYMLQGAIYEANFYSAEVFVRWNEYYNAVADYMKDVNSGSSYQPYYGDTFEDNSLYYDEEIILTLCPGTSLLSKASQESSFQLVRESDSSLSPFFYINAENLVIECGSGGRFGATSRGADGVHYANDPNECILDLTLDSVKDVYTSHISFGPNAQNVVVRGFTFAGASTSSIVFHENEAFERISNNKRDLDVEEGRLLAVFHAPSVSMEDCVFYNNRSLKRNSHTRNQEPKGSIIDIHSYNSAVTMYNCYHIPAPYLTTNYQQPKDKEHKTNTDKKKKINSMAKLIDAFGERTPTIAIRDP